MLHFGVARATKQYASKCTLLRSPKLTTRRTQIKTIHNIPQQHNAPHPQPCTPRLKNLQTTHYRRRSQAIDHSPQSTFHRPHANSTAPHITPRHSTTQHCRPLHSTAHHSTLQNSTAHNTIQQHTTHNNKHASTTLPSVVTTQSCICTLLASTPRE
jgi:hypothetical protein